MKNRILFTLAFALVTSQAYSMSPQQRAAKLRQEEATRATIKANINKIKGLDNPGQIGQLRVETQQLMNSVPRGIKEFQGSLDNALNKSDENVVAAINKNLQNVQIGAQTPKEDNTDYGRLLTVTNFAQTQRQLVQSWATTDFRFTSDPVNIFNMRAINFKAVVAQGYFTENDDTLKEFSNAIKESVKVLVTDAINKVSKDFVNQYKTQLKMQLSAARNEIIAYKNMLISTYVKPLVGKNDNNAKSFKNNILKSAFKLMKAAEQKDLITQADMTSFKTQYNDLLNK